jgi:putative FmdB family regulatory protein
MPLYEYECEACGARFERIQKFSDPPATSCPTCGGNVRKLLSSPAIQFKGTGWYITDYTNKGKADKPSTPPASSSSTESSSGSADSGPTASKSEGNASKSDGKKST